jgi:integrase
LQLPGSQLRELIPAEVGALWDLADPMSRQLLALILSGLSLDECAALRAEHFDPAAGRVRSPGKSEREIELAPAVGELFARSVPLPLWAGDDYRRTQDELAGRIGLLAHDAGLSQPTGVTAEALRHSYVAYLVRQGARLTELERIVGAMPAAGLTRYASFAPTGQAKPLADVDTTYPSLKNPSRRDFSASD